MVGYSTGQSGYVLYTRWTIWILDHYKIKQDGINLCGIFRVIIQYSNGIWNLNHFDHLNTKPVWYSDPRCSSWLIYPEIITMLMICPRGGIFSPKSRVRFPPASSVQFLIELMECDKRRRYLSRKNVTLFQQIVQVHFAKSLAKFVVVWGITVRRTLIGTWRTYFNRVTVSNCCRDFLSLDYFRGGYNCASISAVRPAKIYLARPLLEPGKTTTPAPV